MEISECRPIKSLKHQMFAITNFLHEHLLPMNVV